MKKVFVFLSLLSTVACASDPYYGQPSVSFSYQQPMPYDHYYVPRPNVAPSVQFTIPFYYDRIVPRIEHRDYYNWHDENRHKFHHHEDHHDNDGHRHYNDHRRYDRH